MRSATRISLVTAIFIILCMAHITGAADFPARPITLINPSSPGGMHDILGRIWCAVAKKHLGQPVVITNRPGGGGWQGFVDVKGARPDGYTLLVSTNAHAYREQWGLLTGKPVPVNQVEEFETLGLMNMSPNIFIVRDDSPWKSLHDLVAECKAKPNQFIYGAYAYNTTHYPILVLTDITGIEARPVFYIGGGPVINALLGGHIHFAAQFPASVVPLVQGKKIRALAVTAEKRLPSLPDVPTCKELGYEVVAGQGVGIFSPKKTPEGIIRKLRDVQQKVVADKEFIAMVEKVGESVNPMTPDEFYIEYDRISKVAYKLFQKEAAKIKK